MFPEAIATIDAARLAHNVALLRSAAGPRVRLCAALKANAYGHSLSLVGPLLAGAIDAAAVATLDEALELRRVGFAAPILLLGNVLTFDAANARAVAERAAVVAEQRLTVTLTAPEVVAPLSDAAAARRAVVDVHIKLDTGMGRQGAPPDRFAAILAALRDRPALRLAGVYSHFATADLADAELTQTQIAEFRACLAAHADHLPAGLVRHLSNSTATLTLPAAHLDMVRPGLALYGYAPSESTASAGLKPCLRLLSRITLVKNLPAGHCVGYGCEFKTPRPTRLGIVPVGYADGYSRGLNLRSRPAPAPAVVGTAAGDAPLVGRISMDQLAIDLTDLPASVGVGSEVTLIDDDPARPNSVATLARRLDTIPYEIVCGLGQRIRRVLRT